MAQGDVNGGYVLFVREGRLQYEYNHQGERYHISGPIPTGEGKHQLTLEFEKTGELRGKARLLIDGSLVGSGSIDSTARYMVGWQGLQIGCDPCSPVSWRYPRHFRFTGDLHSVVFTLEEDGPDTSHEVID